MSKEKDNKKIDKKDEEKAKSEKSSTSEPKEKEEVKKKNKKTFKKNIRNRRKRGSRREQEFDSKIISIRRVTRVVAGGRRFGFSVAMVAGNRKGSVGVGVAKANDTALAIEKAMRRAKKNMVTIELTEENSIPYDVKSKFGSSVVEIRPAPGRGLVAGSSVRTVFDLAGINDVSAKILSRSKNQINNARAAIQALKKVGFKRYQSKKKEVQKKAPKERKKLKTKK